MIETYQLLQFLNLPLLLFDLCLLFFDSIDQHDVEVIVLHSFNFPLLIVRDQPRRDGRHVFRAESEISHSAGFLGEADRVRAIQKFKATAKGLHICLITKTGGTNSSSREPLRHTVFVPPGA